MGDDDGEPEADKAGDDEAEDADEEEEEDEDESSAVFEMNDDRYPRLDDSLTMNGDCCDAEDANDEDGGDT